MDSEQNSLTELETYTNMAVVCWNALIVANMGKMVEVNLCTLDYSPITVKVVDAAIKYECPYTGSP